MTTSKLVQAVSTLRFALRGLANFSDVKKQPITEIVLEHRVFQEVLHGLLTDPSMSRVAFDWNREGGREFRLMGIKFTQGNRE